MLRAPFYNTEYVNGALSACDGMKGLPEDKLEVKHPRKGGVRPSPDDNPYNAWLVSPCILVVTSYARFIGIHFSCTAFSSFLLVK